MKLLNFTIIKLTFCLIIGIITASFLKISALFIFIIISVTIVLLLIALLLSKPQIRKTIWFGALAYLTMIAVGILVVHLHDQRAFKTHYSKIIALDDEAKLVAFKVREVLKPTAYHDKYMIDVISIDEHEASGKILLNVEKAPSNRSLNVDDILLASAALSRINLPKNPYQFDYNAYLKKRYIDHQLVVEHGGLLLVSSKIHTIFGFAAALRTKIDAQLRAYNFEKDELAIVDALLLGQRKDISVDTYNNYVNAGAIHILAVSGLHVGIILYLLNWAFRPIERIRKGNYIKIVILVILLWCFAVLAGMSPSVTRAVAMFTVVAIAINLKRPTNIYNTLAISMFFILLFKPMFLFDVGFQMSYTAVFAIASIKPMLASMWHPKPKLLNYYWQLLCVTTAAQIGVVPISLFYFHQFPGLFFLSNLVILPFLGFILGFGILVIILALTNILPHFLAEFFGFCIGLMNDFIAWVSQQEAFIFRNISFGILFLIVTYVMIIAVITYFRRPSYYRLVLVLLAILFLQGSLVYHKRDQQTSELVVFHKSKFSMIGIKENERLTVSDNLDSLTKEKDNIVRNYKVGQAIEVIEDAELQSVYQLKDKHLLVIDSLGVFDVKSFRPDYVLLRNSPKMNLTRLIDSLGPTLIIADGSNYRSYLKRWAITCEKRKIPFHSTYEKGAFVYRY